MRVCILVKKTTNQHICSAIAIISSLTNATLRRFVLFIFRTTQKMNPGDFSESLADQVKNFRDPFVILIGQGLIQRRPQHAANSALQTDGVAQKLTNGGSQSVDFRSEIPQNKSGQDQQQRSENRPGSGSPIEWT